MMLRADSHVRQWEIDNAQSYDTAKVGSSALSAALKRNLKAEVSKWLGKEFAAIFNDYEKYFDTLDLCVLMEEAIYCQFPLSQIAFSLQQHMAPRVLQSDGCTSNPVNINKSILAGCKYSVACTRAYTMRSFISLNEKFPEGNTQLYVDDTSMHASGDTKLEVIHKLIPVMKYFKQIVSKLKLKLFPKAAIVTSCTDLSIKLIKILTMKAYYLSSQVLPGI